MKIRKRAEVLAEVDELADLAQKVDPDMTPEEARSIVWEEVPELYDEYRASTPEEIPAPVAKSYSVRTVANACADAVHAQAERLEQSLREHRTVEEIRADLWTAPDGELLYNLAHSQVGQQPFDTYGQVHKSMGQGEAWAVLRSWLR